MNLKIRFKNPTFWANIVLAIITPILLYMGLTVQDLTSWAVVGNVLLTAVNNPYVLGVVVVNVYLTLVDPTSTGISDSLKARLYDKPNSEKK